MKKILLILIVVAASCKPSKQNVFGCDKWKDGDKLFYDVEIVEKKFKNDSVISEQQIGYKAELDISKTGDSTIITWRMLQQVRKPDSVLTHLQKELNDTIGFSEVLKIVYKVNKQGQYLELLNWKELEEKSDSIWNSEIKKLEDENKSTTPETHKKLAQIKAETQTSPAIEARFTREILALHLAYGLPYSDSIIRLKMAAAGLSDETIPSKITTQIKHNYRDAVCLEITSEPDSRETGRQVNNMVRRMIADSVSEKMTINDTCEVTFNKKTDWAESLLYFRMVTLGDRKNQTKILLMGRKD